MTKDSKDLIVGLDIGTSKVVAIVAEMQPDGSYHIIGSGQHESRGLKKGVVVNIEATVASIQRALEEAELMADCKIRSVFTGIAGNHIRSFNSSGMVAIKDKEVSDADVARVIETAKAVSIPTDQQILHVLPQEFIIDGQEDIREPIGMSGVRLEVRVHIVTGAVSVYARGIEVGEGGVPTDAVELVDRVQDRVLACGFGESAMPRGEFSGLSSRHSSGPTLPLNVNSWGCEFILKSLNVRLPSRRPNESQ
jgi:hypothetical protein